MYHIYLIHHSDPFKRCLYTCSKLADCGGYAIPAAVAPSRTCTLYTNIEMVNGTATTGSEDLIVMARNSAYSARDVLIINHDKNHGWFTGSAITYNSGDPTSPLYSIAHKLLDDEARFKNPVEQHFKFKICYPGKEICGLIGAKGQYK